MFRQNRGLEIIAGEEVDPKILIQFSTITGLLPLWMSNMAQNMENILQGKDVRDLKRVGGPALVIGAGPSVRELKHLEMLKKSKYDGTIIATDRMLIPILKAGIVPDYVCSVDADVNDIPPFFDHKLVDMHKDDITAIFSTFVSKNVFDHWKGDNYFFITAVDDLNSATSLTRGLHYMTKNTVIPGVGDVGGMSWQFAHGLECNPIILIGMDYSEKKLTDLPDYHQYYKNVDPKVRDVKKYFHRHYNPFFKNFCWSGLLFESCYDTLKDRFKMLYPHGQRTINCTGGGLIHGPHVECMHFQDFLRKYEEGSYENYKP